jgi:uncharacterized membrane protein/uncharacterized RDD family membrane protein YckC
VVDGWLVGSNVVQTIAFLAELPLLWLFLYLFAWTDPERARDAGFGRRTFWLLVVGGILGYLGDLPFFAIGHDVLAISVGGGIIPLVLSGLFLRRLSAGRTPAQWRFLGLLVGETAAALLAAIFLSNLLATILVVGLAVVATALAVVLVARELAPVPKADWVLASALALASGGIAVTFLATESLPGLGIVSAFPYYLLAPLGIGVVAVAVVDHLKLPPMWALPLAYASTTLGVLIGADVLRQPPLYAGGVPAIYVIGGAGPGDLLYLSGLMAVVGAWAFDRFTHRGLARSSPAASAPPPTPESLLRNSVQLSLDGDSAGAVRLAGAAADEALDRTRRLLGAPPPSTGALWGGLSVPPWVDLDHRNLRALVVSKERRPRDAARAWWTARWLVRLSRELGRPRFATPGRRFLAGLVDFLLIAVPATVAWISIVLLTGGPVTDVLTGVPLNAAAIGYAAWGFGYFVLAEHWFGTTVGKRLFHLAVTDRSLRRPAAIPALLRNTPKLIPLTVVGVVGAETVVVLLRGFSGLGLSTTSSLLPEVTVIAAIVLLLTLGVGIPTAAGAFGMSFSSENQRLGDLLAGTWVLNERPSSVVPPGASAPAVPRSA